MKKSTKKFLKKRQSAASAGGAAAPAGGGGGGGRKKRGKPSGGGGGGKQAKRDAVDGGRGSSKRRRTAGPAGAEGAAGRQQQQQQRQRHREREVAKEEEEEERQRNGNADREREGEDAMLAALTAKGAALRNGGGGKRKGGGADVMRAKDFKDMDVREFLEMDFGQDDEEEEENEPESDVDDEDDDDDDEFGDGGPEVDPELLANDPGETDSDDDSDDDDDDDDDSDNEKEDEQERAEEAEEADDIPDSVRVTPSMVNTLVRNVFSPSAAAQVSMRNAGRVGKPLKQLVSLFAAACRQDMSIGETSAEAQQRRAAGRRKYHFTSADAVETVVRECLDHLHEAFWRVLLDTKKQRKKQREAGRKKGGATGENILELAEEVIRHPDRQRTLNKQPSWSSMQPLLVSFFKTVLYVFDNVSNPEELAYFTTSLSDFVGFLAPLRLMTRKLTKALLQLWATGPDPTEDEHNCRALAFLCIRKMALTCPSPVLEDCLKATYLTFVRNSKFSTEQTLPSIHFMANCVRELYGLNVAASYQRAFVYVRQIAMHLRAAMAKQTADTASSISSWMFLHSLRLWVRIVCDHPGQDALGSLVFPLSQIIEGVARFRNNDARYLPLRLQLVMAIQQLAASANVFAPTAPLLLESLQLSPFSRPPVASTDKPAQVWHCLKLSASDVGKKPVQEMLVREIMDLLQSDADLYRYSAGFPEYAFPTIVALNAFVKTTKVMRWKTMARGMIETLKHWSTDIKQRRATITEAPKDAVDMALFKPEREPAAPQRLHRFLTRKFENDTSSLRTIVLTKEEIDAEATRAAAAAAAAAEDDEDKDEDEDEEEENDKEDGEDEDGGSATTATATATGAANAEDVVRPFTFDEFDDNDEFDGDGGDSDSDSDDDDDK